MIVRGCCSLGLCGYEVRIFEGGYVKWRFVGVERENERKAKIRYTKGGEPYFLAHGHRIHL